MKENIAKTKAMQFSVEIYKLQKALRMKSREFVLADQLLRSATSIGANIAEGQFAASERDLLSKLQIALKEAGETAYWLELLYHISYLPEEQYREIAGDCDELIKILAASTRTISAKIRRNDS